jgi:erythromycin esterase
LPSIEGSVRGANGPVAGAIVAANRYGQDVPHPLTTRTDSAGAFRFELEPGTFALTATAPGQTAAYVPDLVVTKGGHLTPVVELGGKAVVFQARVSAQKGALPPKVVVQAVRISEVDGDVFIFDGPSDGLLELTLPGASYMLTATAGELTSPVAFPSPGERAELVLYKQAASGPPTPAALATLQRHLFPLTAVEAGHGSADLVKLDPLFEGARIVELGEATHGTREFFQLKHRLLEYLVEAHGFRIFAIEATQPEAFEINDYVLTGKGDPRKALAGLYFWTWDTEEVLAMIEWMRSWNAQASHTPKLKFYGVDMQHPVRAAQLVAAYLKTSAPKLEPRFAPVLAALADPLFNPTVEWWGTAQKTLAELAAELDSKPGKGTFARARQSLRVLEQNAVVSLETITGDGRDQAMAANALWVLDQEGPDSKMVLWAHNGHVSYEGHAMGAALKRALGAKVKSFGFGFGAGGFQAREFVGTSGLGGLRNFEAPPAPPDTFDGACLALQQPLFVLDLNGLYADPAVAPFEGQVRVRSYGAGSGEEALSFFNPTVLEGSHDAWIFVAQTTAARGNPSGQRPWSTPGVPSNLSFEEGLAHWAVNPSETLDYTCQASTRAPKDGKQALLISRPKGSHYGPGEVAEVWQAIAPAGFLGKRLRLEAWVKVSDTMRVSVELRARGGSQKPSPDNVTVVGGTDHGSWTKVSAELDVSEAAKTIDLRLLVAGEGAAFVDGLTLTEVPRP